jgi:hypothetical protein
MIGVLSCLIQVLLFLVTLQVSCLINCFCAFFQVSVVDGRSKIRFVPLQRLTVPYLLLSLHWLNTRTLATVDTMEQLHLMDVRTQEELEVLDLAEVRLVYGTSYFKGLATGGNVSRAMVS